MPSAFIYSDVQRGIWTTSWSAVKCSNRWALPIYMSCVSSILSGRTLLIWCCYLSVLVTVFKQLITQTLGLAWGQAPVSSALLSSTFPQHSRPLLWYCLSFYQADCTLSNPNLFLQQVYISMQGLILDWTVAEHHLTTCFVHTCIWVIVTVTSGCTKYVADCLCVWVRNGNHLVNL